MTDSVDGMTDDPIIAAFRRQQAEKRRALEELTKRLVDDGELIEAGWMAMRFTAIQENASAAQLDDMRTAFFAGAQHLFGSIMSMLDPDAEVTDDDLRRMGQIQTELDRFIKQYEQRHRPAGSA